MEAYSASRTSSMKASRSVIVPRRWRRAGQRGGAGGPLRDRAGQGARERRLGDARDRHAQVERVLHGPAARALLLRLVEHDVDERAARLGVHVREDVGGDLDEERLEVARVPLGEDLPDLRGRGTQPLAQQVVRLGDELHVGVLDAVVHHLDEVAGAVRADVGAARHAVDLGRDLLEDRAEGLVRLLGPAGHDRRAEQRALLAAGDAGADEVQALLAQRGLAPDRVGEVRVAGVDDDVALLQEAARARR